MSQREVGCAASQQTGCSKPWGSLFFASKCNLVSSKDNGDPWWIKPLSSESSRSLLLVL